MTTRYNSLCRIWCHHRLVVQQDMLPSPTISHQGVLRPLVTTVPSRHRAVVAVPLRYANDENVPHFYALQPVTRLLLFPFAGVPGGVSPVQFPASRSPRLRMFSAAFTSRSLTAPQLPHSYVLVFKGIF